MRKMSLTTALAVVSTALAAIPVTHALSQVQPQDAPAEDRPNIVVIMTDDQDVASLSVMPHVKELLAGQGTTFSKHTVIYPLCCPSRAAYLSGQVGHNNNVRENTAPGGGYGNLDTSKTVPVFLSEAGYVTTHLGKYPNGYDGSQHPGTGGVPPGWTEWHGAVDPTTYEFYGYTLNENGVNVTHGVTEADYQTDVLTNTAVDFIDRRSGGDAPFFLDVAYLAPHWEFRPGTSNEVNPGDLEGITGLESQIGTPPVPAKRHKGMYVNAVAPRGPAYNEADVSDKPQFVKNSKPLSEAQINLIDRWNRRRLESLQAVDEGVARIVKELADKGELDNTFFFFTADNGWLQGEHRLALQKVHVYEESVHIPLIIRGPGVVAGATVTDLTSSLDLPSTFLDLAGAQLPDGYQVDGMSLRPYLENPHKKLGRAVFVETSPGSAGYLAVKAGPWKYVEYNNGDRELYNLETDPYELASQHAEPARADLIAQLAKLLEQFRTCKGTQCVFTGYGGWPSAE